jgi:5-oxoprolinase (ATP-hydrolysing)
MWEFWIDRGGTFTDIVSISPKNQVFIDKYLSVNKRKYNDAAVFAIRQKLETKDFDPVDSSKIKQIRLGTTVATNALLERKGAKTLLITNKGYKDIFGIGNQKRPDIFALNIIKPEKIYEKVIETSARTDKNGNIISDIDTGYLRSEIKKAYENGIKSCAIVLMHGYKHPDFENKIAEILKEFNFDYIFPSHKSAPVIKITGRGDTTCIDSYLTPVLKEYSNNFINELLKGNESKRKSLSDKILFMHSGGGLVSSHIFMGKESILSGPAGGIAGAVKACELENESKLLSFDMGGTSTDVSHYSKEFERVYETEVSGVKIFYPMLDIHTVAAGGGSIADFDGEKLRVGPHSAGSDPGPACYRNNGPLTVTDCNLFLGRIRKEFFPKVFGKNFDQEPDTEILEEKFKELKNKIYNATNKSMTEQEIASGFLKIASEKMASAIKKISLQKGRDAKKYILCSFGGAGGQHACEIADILSMEKILIHPYAGVLSAYGIGVSDKSKVIEKSLNISLDNKNLELADKEFKNLLNELLISQSIKPDIINKKILLKYQGSDIPVVVNYSDNIEKIREEFNTNHKLLFGFLRKTQNLVISSISLEIIEKSIVPKFNTHFSTSEPKPEKRVKVFFKDNYLDTDIYKRENLIPGFKIKGTAIITEKTGTTLVLQGWTAQVKPSGNLILTKDKSIKKDVTQKIDLENPDPVYLEIFNSLFSYIAQEMGITLEKTAYSVNIKERKDFSCAVFDSKGNLVANAPHIPVHLGSMESSVTGLLNNVKNISPGDIFVSNNPLKGGTHLPDLTVISPVFESMIKKTDKAKDTLLFFVASRGHHSDIGGISPGSMPSDSKTLMEEGVILDNVKIFENHTFLEEKLRKILLDSKYPCRNPDSNISDIKSQVAANTKGIKSLEKAVSDYGLETIIKYMEFIRINAKNSVEKKIDFINPGSFEIKLDNESVIRVKISKNQNRLKIDFTGTSKASEDNYNAPEAVTKAAVLYVLRTIVNDDIPLNSGCLEPVDIIIPEGSILSPPENSALCAGNVEISQVICDLLFSALKILASSQGTMNNITFGNKDYQYYETICGGAPAGNGFNGADAVHTHMTNSLITDPEIMESRLPVILEEFSIRENSGGKGKFSGGCGVKRVIKFNENMDVSFLTNKRVYPPHGIESGESGKPGENIVVYKNGEIYKAEYSEAVSLSAGDKIVVKTPGGGGFGCV